MFTKREARISVMLPVRIRLDSGWTDGCIRNVSSRGVLLQISSPPPKGSYIEIRRRDVVIVGQVRWLGQDCCGLRTQDKVPVEHLMANRDGAAPNTPKPGDKDFVDRRATARVMTPQEAAEQNRLRARIFEKAVLVAAGVCGALVIATLMFETLQKSIGVVTAHL